MKNNYFSRNFSKNLSEPNSHEYFCNSECKYFPCHDIKSISDKGQHKFNCLFCYCPLYNTDCEGNYNIIYDLEGNPIKDCSQCLIPHTNYQYIVDRLKDNIRENNKGQYQFKGDKF